MAKVSKRTRNGRVTWLVRWRDPSRTQKKKTFSHRYEADRYRVEIEQSLFTGGYIDPASSQVTVGEWSKTWLAQLQVKLSTATRYEALLRIHVLPTWQNVPLQAVTYIGVGDWVTELVQKGLAPSTIRQAHRVFSLILSLAVRDNRIARNPASGVRLPRPSAIAKRFLTHQEVARLVDAAGDQGLVIQTLAYTGLRFGELAALRVRNVDLVKRRLQVVESVTEVRGHALFGSTKTHAVRSVGLPPLLCDGLAARVEDLRDDAFLFPAPRGGVLRLRNWRRDVFDPAARSAGLDGLTPHELRHTAASLAIAAGANVKAVQRMLGHASAAMTLDVYSGLFEDDLDNVAQRLNDQARAQAPPR